MPSPSQSQPGGGVVAEQGTFADVAAHGRKRPVAGLLHDGEFARAVHGGLSGEAGAQTVAGVVRGIEAGPARGAFHDPADGVAVEPGFAHEAKLVDRPEQGPGRKGSEGKPGTHGAHRAGQRIGSIGQVSLFLNQVLPQSRCKLPRFTAVSAS
jgi:hypothetical protein